MLFVTLTFYPIYVCYPMFDSIKNWKMIVQIDYDGINTMEIYVFRLKTYTFVL